MPFVLFLGAFLCSAPLVFVEGSGTTLSLLDAEATTPLRPTRGLLSVCQPSHLPLVHLSSLFHSAE
jgi:hypothetical protein